MRVGVGSIFGCWAALAAATAAADTDATLHGIVGVLGSPDPVAGAVVQWQGNSLTARSGPDGGYRLRLPPGPARLRFSADGFDPQARDLSVSAGADIRLDVPLRATTFEGDSIQVRGRRERPQTVSTTLDQAEIKRIPGTAGDALRAVANLPGVAMPSDYTSQLVVQGGGPNDNLYLLDNLPWPFPFHFGGVISTVNSDLLSSVDLHAAGYGARWGNSLDAVLDAQTRAGRPDRLHATADVSAIMSQGLVEGPLGLGDATFTLAGRRSYFELVLPHLNTADYTALPVFWDLGGSLDFSLGPDNHVRALWVSNDDVLGLMINADHVSNPALVGEFSLHNSASTLGLTWSNSSVRGLRVNVTPYYYQVHVDDKVGTGVDINNLSNVAGLKVEDRWAPGGAQEWGFGGELRQAWVGTRAYLFDKGLAYLPSVSPTAASTDVTVASFSRDAYLEDRIQLAPPLALTLGLHYSKNDLVADDTLSPRAALELRTPGGLLWKAAWGRYAEFPSGLQLNPDLGSSALSAQLAEHSALSVEKDLGAGRSLRLDGYYKTYSDLVLALPQGSQLGPEGDFNNQGRGHALGLDVFLRQSLGARSFGWLSYAWSRSERSNAMDGAWDLYQYDQTHIANLVLGTLLTPTLGVGLKLRYNTGPLVQSVVGTAVGPYGLERTVSYAYDQRLGDYLRLDLRVQDSFLFIRWRVNTYFEILNVLDRANPEGLNYPKDVTQAPTVIDDLPFFPYFGIEAEY